MTTNAIILHGQKIFPVMDDQYGYAQRELLRSLNDRGVVFRVIGIPWGLIVQHEQQCQRNHGGQSVQRLFERGGLSACEAVAVLEDRGWHRMDEAEAHSRLFEIVSKYVEGLVNEDAYSLILSPHEIRTALDGRLGLVVRPVKPQPEYQDATGRWTFCVSSSDKNSRDKWSYCVIDAEGHHHTERGRERCVLNLRDPFGVPGDRLCCRETWGHTGRIWKAKDATKDTDGQVVYQIDHDVDGPDFQWWSPATMPAWASRITLEVVGVRCVRLHQLCENDMRKAYGIAMATPASHELYKQLRTSFEAVWDAQYAKRGLGWDSNPWAWAVEVRRVR